MITEAKTIARYAVTAAAVLALAAMAACGPKPATNTTNATNAAGPPNGLGLGLGAYNGTASGASGGMTGGNAMAGGVAGPDGQSGFGSGAVGTSGSLGGPTGGPDGSTGGQAGGDQSGANGQGFSSQNLAALGQQWDSQTYNSCVPSAEHSGASTQVAQTYCQCVVNALDQLPAQQRIMLTPQSAEVAQAVQQCRPTSLQ